jgi:hypothetical protein
VAAVWSTVGSNGEGQLIDAYDAALIERRDNGKVKIAKKHETWSSRCSHLPRLAEVLSQPRPVEARSLAQ